MGFGGIPRLGGVYFHVFAYILHISYVVFVNQSMFVFCRNLINNIFVAKKINKKLFLNILFFWVSIGNNK
jgi:hypothetical protein